MGIDEIKILATNSTDQWVNPGTISEKVDSNAENKGSNSPESKLAGQKLLLFGKFIKIINKLGTVERFEVIKDSNSILLYLKESVTKEHLSSILEELENHAQVRLFAEIRGLKIKLTPY